MHSYFQLEINFTNEKELRYAFAGSIRNHCIEKCCLMLKYEIEYFTRNALL